MPYIENLENEKYINLETYKKDASPVKTPVWFVLLDDGICFVTREETGKVKRLKNDRSVRIAICDVKGNVTGTWNNGIATILTGDESARVLKLRDKKYGFLAKLAKFASRGKGNFIAYSIKLKS